MTQARVGFDVQERWQLRNGSIAVITQRDGSVSVGHIEGTVQIYIWRRGKTLAGRGYDLMRIMEDSRQ